MEDNPGLPPKKFFALLLILIAVLGGLLAYMAFQQSSQPNGSINANNPGNLGINTTIDVKECVRVHGFNPDSLLYYYSDSCPVCRKIRPEIESLKVQGYKISLVHADNPRELTVFSDCFAKRIDLTASFHQVACPRKNKVFGKPAESTTDLVKALKECSS